MGAEELGQTLSEIIVPLDGVYDERSRKQADRNGSCQKEVTEIVIVPCRRKRSEQRVWEAPRLQTDRQTEREDCNRS